jgi:hypothetical protein
MKPTTRLKLENVIRRLIREEWQPNDRSILAMARKLRDLDNAKRDISDPDTGESKAITAKLINLGVLSNSGEFVKTHPLYSKISRIYG